MNFEPVKVYDGLACYRLLAAVFEIPELLSTVLEKHSVTLSRDLCIAWMIAGSDQLRAIDAEELEDVASQ
jgi:hypothetical protein